MAPALAPALAFASNHIPAVAFGALWISGTALAHIHVLEIQSNWTATVYGVLLFTLVSIVCGTALGERTAAPTTSAITTAVREPDARLLRMGALVCLAIGYGELLYRFAVAGTVPLLSSDVDTARFALPGGPMTVLRDGLMVAAIAVLSRPRRLWSRDAMPDLAIAAVALGGFALEGARTPVFLPIAVVFLVRSLRFGLPPARRLLIGTGVLLLIASALFYLRTAQHPSGAFGAELYGSIVPDTPLLLRPLLPIFIAIVTNFEALARLVEHFPAVEPFAHGVFSGYAYDAVIPGTRQIGLLSQQLSPPWTTSTVAGSLWADGGFVGVGVGGLVIGALVGGAVELARRTHSLSAQLAGGYLLFLLLFGCYTNLFTQHPDWLIVTPLLVLLGEVAAPSAGLRSRSARYSRRVQAIRETVAGGVRRRGLLYVATVCLCLLITGLVLTVTLPDRDAGSNPLTPAATFDLPAVAVAPGTMLATDGDNYSDNEPLWAIQVRGGVARVMSIGFAGDSANIRSTDEIRLRGPAPDGVDVARWGGPNGTASLVTTKFVRSSLLTRVYDLQTKRLVVDGTIPLPELDTGVTRNIAVATVSGKRPDVIVIDRGSSTARVLVTVISGESRFRHVDSRTRLPFGGFAPDTWRVDFGRQRSGSIGLMAFRTRSSGLRHTEVHVTSDAERSQPFYLERELLLPARLPPRTRLISGQYQGAPAVFAVYRSGRPRVVIFPLAPRVKGI